MALANIMAGSGYRDRRDQIEKQDAALQSNTINQAGALQRIYQSQEAMRTGAADRATALQDRQMLESVMSQTGGDPERAIQALLKAGTPKSIELASKLSRLVPKPDKAPQPQLVTRVGPDGKPRQEWIVPGQSTGVDLGQKYVAPDKPGERWGEPYDMNGAMVQKNLDTGQIRTAVSRPPSDQVALTIGPMPAAPVGATAMPADVQGPAATGGSGFFGGMANTVADAFGAQMPYPNVERATQALKNLRVQTITLMQDAVPGRPSNYLMQQIEQLAVTPGSLLQGDQRAEERLSRTREMLATEVARMEREVLSQPRAYTAAQMNKTRQSHGALRQLMAEYDRVLGSFRKGPQAGATPPPPAGFVPDSP